MRSFNPRPDQLETISAITTALAAEGTRASAILPCGYGKTFVAQQAAERLTAELDEPLILVAVPNLVLVDQMIQDWTKNASDGHAFTALPVNSRRGRAREDEITGITIEGITSDIDEIARFLAGAGRRVVFTTYQSMDTIADAVQKVAVWRPGFAFDLAIADEAHRTAGPVRGGEPSSYKTILDDTRIPAHRRSFYTATPRVASAKAGSDEHPYSMDNEATYGPTVVNRSLTWAQQQGLLVEHDVFVVQVDHDGLERVLEANPLIRVDGSAEEARMVAAAIALVQTARSRHLRSVITYHSNIAKAQSFQRLLEAVEQALPASEKPTGKLRTGHVNGAMPTTERTSQLSLLDMAGAPSGDWSVVTNCNCLAEGVNIPSVDAIAMIDPRKSLINIVQSIGRPVRLDSTRPSKRATVLVPAYIGTAATAEEAIEEGSFEAVFQVIKALAESDRALAESFRQAAAKDAADESEERAAIGFADHDRDWAEGETPESRVTFVGPASGAASESAHLGGELVDWSRWHESLRTAILDRQTTAADQMLDALRRFVHTHGRLPMSKEHFEGLQLGPWLLRQRAWHRAGRLRADLAAQILAIDPKALDSVHEETYNAAVETLGRFVAAHGRLPKRGEMFEGINLGDWLIQQRYAERSGRLSPERAARIREIHPRALDNPKDENFEAMVATLARFVAALGRLPKGKETFEGVRIGAWLNDKKQDAREGRLSPERAERIRAVDPKALGVPHEEAFEEMACVLERFFAAHGRAPRFNESFEGAAVGPWLARQRVLSKRGELAEARAVRIESISPGAFGKGLEEAFDGYLDAFTRFYKAHGRLPKAKETFEDMGVGGWFSKRRAEFRRGTLSPERAAAILAVSSTAFAGIEAPAAAAA